MKTTVIIAIAGLASIASADILLNIDLTVVDQITITATGGLSAASVSGSDTAGVLMADFYSSAPGSLIEGFVSGDLTAANDIADNSPNLFNSAGSVGLNLWSWTDDFPSTFTAGALAFSGSATWTLSASEYADMINGNLSGDIYAYADRDSDIPTSTIIGTYSVIPAPGSLALLGLGGIVAGRRRRR